MSKPIYWQITTESYVNIDDMSAFQYHTMANGQNGVTVWLKNGETVMTVLDSKLWAEVRRRLVARIGFTPDV